jgi:hypothetical protein
LRSYTSRIKPVLVSSIMISLLLLPAGSSAQTVTPAQWQKFMQALPAPSWGCFEANYPNMTWTPTQCNNNSVVFGTFLVGGGPKNDWSGTYVTPITSESGTFFSETGFSSECSTTTGGCSSGYITNAYSDQINTNLFAYTGTLCSGVNLQGWEQFVYADSGQSIYNTGVLIEYWLYGCNSCPSSPGTWHGTPSSGCYTYYSQPAAKFPPSGLYQQTLTGSVSATQDQATFCGTTTSCVTTSTSDLIGIDVGGNSAWTIAEFNAFGYDSGHPEAVFNSGFSIKVLNQVSTPLTYCDQASFTGETNNLNLWGCSANTNGYITFQQSD